MQRKLQFLYTDLTDIPYMPNNLVMFARRRAWMYDADPSSVAMNNHFLSLRVGLEVQLASHLACGHRIVGVSYATSQN